MIEQAEYNRTVHYDETYANNMLQLNLITDKLYEVMKIMRRLKAPILTEGPLRKNSAGRYTLTKKFISIPALV